MGMKQLKEYPYMQITFIIYSLLKEETVCCPPRTLLWSTAPRGTRTQMSKRSSHHISLATIWKCRHPSPSYRSTWTSCLLSWVGRWWLWVARMGHKSQGCFPRIKGIRFWWEWRIIWFFRSHRAGWLWNIAHRISAGRIGWFHPQLLIGACTQCFPFRQE